jgi:hypothetical protein
VLLKDLQRCFHLFISHRHHLLILRAGDGDRTRDVQGRKTVVFHRVSRPERPSCQLGKLAFNTARAVDEQPVC